MGYKMKGMSFMQGQSPMRKINAGGKKKTIAGEDTDIIKTDKKGKDYALSMFDQASGINKGDTLFTPKYKIPSTYGYVRGGENYDAIETEDSKKRKKGPKSYTLKTQKAPTKLKKKDKKPLPPNKPASVPKPPSEKWKRMQEVSLKKKGKKKKQDFKPAYPGADISKAEYDKARKAGVTSEAEYAKYKAKMKKKKKSPTKLKRKIKPTKAILRAKDIKKPGRKMPLGKPGNIKRVKKTSPTKWVQAVAALAPIALELMKKKKEK